MRLSKSIGLSPLSLALLAVLGVAPLFVQDDNLLQLLIASLLLGAQAIAFDFTVGLINVMKLRLVIYGLLLDVVMIFYPGGLSDVYGRLHRSVSS